MESHGHHYLHLQLDIKYYRIRGVQMRFKAFSISLFILCSILLLGACSGKGDEATKNIEKEDLDNVNETGMPIVDEEIELNFFAGKAPATADDWNDVLVFNKYEEMTNIDVKWKMVPWEGLTEQRNLSLSSNNLPDAYHSAVIPVTDILKYGEQGMFIPLNDLIDKYAPNFKKILDENPEIKKAITFPDGNIYSFPLISDPDFTALQISEGPWIRQDWLDELGMHNPETTEELYEYLKAVKEKDPGNNNAIPLGSQSIGGILTWLKGSFGVGNRGQTHQFIDMDPERNQLRFYPISDDYKEMLEYVKKLYDEGLIEKNIFTLEHDRFYANGAEGVYGSVYNHSPEELFSGDIGKNYTGGNALEGPHGEKAFSGIGFPSSITGFVITSANEHPAATVRWMDYFYSDEGARMFFMGFEGETYEVTEDGEYEYIDEIANNPELSLDQAVAQYLTWPGGQYPGILKEDYFKGAEGAPSSKEAAKKLEPYFVEEVWPSFTYTDEEIRIMTSSGADLEKYVNEMRDKFISGSESLDEWDKYVETVKNIGLDEYMEVQEKAYKRFTEN